MSLDLWIAIGLLVLLVVILIIGRDKKGSRCPHAINNTQYVVSDDHFFTLKESDDVALPTYAILDFQTTGLDVERDRIVQAAWLVLDDEYRQVRKGVCLVSQDIISSSEARAVHGLNTQVLSKHGIPEEKMLELLWKDISDVPRFVAHNIEFDLGMLKSSIQRFHPEWLPAMESKKTICTMIDFLEVKEESKYPSLLELSAQVGCRVDVRHMPHPIAWRNVCLTRFCLIRLSQRVDGQDGNEECLIGERDQRIVTGSKFLFPKE